MFLGCMPVSAAALSAAEMALHCDVAAERAARSTGVPAAVLMAIARVETGRKVDGAVAPWPWTVNEAGKGAWFESKHAAVAHVQAAMVAGASNIDIGCFQVNLRWHGEGFSSLDAMFDPAINADYAARFLQSLHDEHGTWDGAVGAYHSRKPEAATRYVQKVAEVLDIPPAAAAAPATTTSPRVTLAPRDNRYPLLQGGSGGNGSLFSSDAQGAQPLLR